MKSLYLNNRLFIAATILGFLFLVSHFVPILFFIVKMLLLALVVLLLIDIFLLYRTSKGIVGQRLLAEKLSNGDPNPINIYLENKYAFPINTRVIDEIPFQFQVRDTDYKLNIKPKQTENIAYDLRPTERGEYNFGKVNVYASTPIGLASRRYQLGQEKTVPVYPSFLQMHKYELLAISNRLTNYGVKKIRRIGQTMEFEQIKKYVQGDDYRNVNWKATARKNELMVNQFQDEKSQNVYSIIDKGRLMKMPFNGLTLLDYSINASLVISNIAIKKGDKAGLVTFSKKIESVLKASKMGAQIRNIQEVLYNQKTDFSESDYEKLYALLRTRLNNRSLVLLYTNFESISSLNRQLPYLRKIARQHVLVVVFFENTELTRFTRKKVKDVQAVYDKIIAEKFDFEKRLIVKELKKYGIQSVLTAPEDLTVNTINKYLEIKARGII